MWTARQTDTAKLQSLLAILQTRLTRLERHEAYKMKLALQAVPEILCFRIQNLISSTLRLFKWLKSFSTNGLQNNNIKEDVQEKRGWKEYKQP